MLANMGRMRRPMGNYYATALTTTDRVQPNGNPVCKGHQVARQAKTLRAAMAALDATGLPGYVQRWDERTQQRYVVADRDTDGRWTSTNPYTGEKEEIKR